MKLSIPHAISGLILALTSLSAGAATLAWWHFEEGPAQAAVAKPFGAKDSSGNGNHLDPSTAGGSEGFLYRSEVGYSPMPQSQAVNRFSLKNSGSNPSLATHSQTLNDGPGSHPEGIDLELIEPVTFTIEAFFKPEGGASYRTIVGRDATGVAAIDDRLGALYFQIQPDQSVAIAFADVSGYWHEAISPAGLITGFNWPTDHEGVTGRWYYMAAVCNGNSLSLYLANVSVGSDPHLVAQTNLAASGSPNRALSNGNASGSNWHAGGWSVGRGLWDGKLTDRAWGYIDEVRISDTALNPAQFLMAPKPTVDRNPVMYGADPDNLLVNDRIWIYTTSGPSTQFFAYSSTDLVNWTTHGPILDFRNIAWLPSGKNAWAPGVIAKNGKYYFYYSAGPKPSHIGVAVSNSPAGPFVDSGRALLSDNNDPSFEAIDAMAFTDPKTGTSYLYAGGSAGSRLRVFELTSDMISFAREIPVANPSKFTEGAFMHTRNGIYYLSYSYGSWNMDSYSVHYCTAPGPTGPWTYRGAILQTEAWHKGPGHHSFRYNPALDEWYIIYHRWNNRTGSGPYSGSRSVAIERIKYTSDGLIQPIRMTDTGVGPVRLNQGLLSDFDGNGVVDGPDKNYLIAAWLTSNPKADIAPTSRDGIVNLPDLNTFSTQWRKSFPEK